MSDERKFRFLLWAGMVFLVTGYLSCVELKYMMWGETTDAKIMKVTKGTESRGRFQPRREVWGVRFAYDDLDGTKRENVVNMPIDWKEPAEGTLKIDFVPGKERTSRLHGKKNLIPVYMFGGAILFALFVFIKLFRQAYD